MLSSTKSIIDQESCSSLSGFFQFRSVLTQNSPTNWARMNSWRSLLDGTDRMSGTVLWTGVFFWPAVPSMWQSNPA